MHKYTVETIQKEEEKHGKNCWNLWHHCTLWSVAVYIITTNTRQRI